jgi:hypothetical protein
MVASLADEPMLRQMGIRFPLSEVARNQCVNQVSKLNQEIKTKKSGKQELKHADIAERQKGVQFLDSVMKFDDLVKSMGDDVKLHYRVFVDLGQDRQGQPIQLDLLRTEAPEQPKPPAKQGGGGKKQGGEGNKQPAKNGEGDKKGGKKPAANNDGNKKANGN